MSRLRIVHLCPTPLVGAPGKIARAQRGAGHDAVAYASKDYPKGGPLEGFFTSDLILIDDAVRDEMARRLAAADIVHVHNFLPGHEVSFVRDCARDARFVYHVHSPLREGPLFTDRSGEHGLEYARRLVVGQYAGRMYPDFVPVPNLILDEPSVQPQQAGERLRVLFSPTHDRPGRWNNKHSEGLQPLLESLSSDGVIEAVIPSRPIPPDQLMELRRSCHVSIDEIETGAFHQVSLEALCAGNVAINRADFFARSTYAKFCEGEMPPFTHATARTIEHVLRHLAERPTETATLQRRNVDFFRRFCDAARQVRWFDDAY